NLQGLSLAFPPAYLLSFIIDSESEPLEGDDLPLVTRSRMTGVPGLTYKSPDIEASLAGTLASEILVYKQYRWILSRASGILLSAQAPADPDSWDVLEELADDGSGAVILAFKSDRSDGRLLVRPRGLQAGGPY